LKPFLYLLAFSKLGWNSDTEIADEPIAFTTSMGTPWEPKNYDLEYKGDVTVRQALAQSLNIPAAKTLDAIGVDEFIGFLEKFGIDFADSDADFGLSAALGTPEMRLLSLAHAYGVLARGGKDFDFNVFSETSSMPYNQITSRDDALEVINILSDNNARIDAFGEDSALSFAYQVAAKTGTTRDFRDNFAIGFTSEVVVFVWVGNADGSPMREVSGITGAGPIFNKVMNLVMQNRPKKDFDIPKNTTNNSVEILDDVQTADDFRIILPADNARFYISPDLSLESQKIRFKASDACDWFIDDVNIGSEIEILWLPKKGKVEIVAKNKNEMSKISILVE